MLSVFLQMAEGRLCQVNLLDDRKLELLVQVLDTLCLHILKDYIDVLKVCRISE